MIKHYALLQYLYVYFMATMTILLVIASSKYISKSLFQMHAPFHSYKGNESHIYQFSVHVQKYVAVMNTFLEELSQ